MTHHELKILPRWFDAVGDGVKTCEMRYGGYRSGKVFGLEVRDDRLEKEARP